MNLWHCLTGARGRIGRAGPAVAAIRLPVKKVNGQLVLLTRKLARLARPLWETQTAPVIRGLGMDNLISSPTC